MYSLVYLSYHADIAVLDKYRCSTSCDNQNDFSVDDELLCNILVS